MAAVMVNYLMRLRALIDIQLPGQFCGYSYLPTPGFLALRAEERALVAGVARATREDNDRGVER
jgi:hypothetical protein